VSIQHARWCWAQTSRQLCPHPLHIPKTAAATKTKGFFFLWFCSLNTSFCRLQRN
jgi:hypothetical protein